MVLENYLLHNACKDSLFFKAIMETLKVMLDRRSQARTYPSGKGPELCFQNLERDGRKPLASHFCWVLSAFQMFFVKLNVRHFKPISTFRE